MNASKEECDKAIVALQRLYNCLRQGGQFQGDYTFVREFLTKARAKLPSEASFASDKSRGTSRGSGKLIVIDDLGSAGKPE